MWYSENALKMKLISFLLSCKSSSNTSVSSFEYHRTETTLSIHQTTRINGIVCAESRTEWLRDMSDKSIYIYSLISCGYFDNVCRALFLFHFLQLIIFSVKLIRFVEHCPVTTAQYRERNMADSVMHYLKLHRPHNGTETNCKLHFA